MSIPSYYPTENQQVMGPCPSNSDIIDLTSVPNSYESYSSGEIALNCAHYSKEYRPPTPIGFPPLPQEFKSRKRKRKDRGVLACSPTPIREDLTLYYRGTILKCKKSEFSLLRKLEETPGEEFSNKDLTQPICNHIFCRFAFVTGQQVPESCQSYFYTNNWVLDTI